MIFFSYLMLSLFLKINKLQEYFRGEFLTILCSMMSECILTWQQQQCSTDNNDIEHWSFVFSFSDSNQEVYMA